MGETFIGCLCLLDSAFAAADFCRRVCNWTHFVNDAVQNRAGRLKRRSIFIFPSPIFKNSLCTRSSKSSEEAPLSEFTSASNWASLEMRLRLSALSLTILAYSLRLAAKLKWKVSTAPKWRILNGAEFIKLKKCCLKHRYSLTAARFRFRSRGFLSESLQLNAFRQWRRPK